MPVFAYESAMASLSAEINANGLLYQQDEKKAWVLNEELFEKMKRQLREVKSDICKQCKKNFELEKEVRFFDQRIALLINHKISVEEFPDNISFGEHRLGALKDDIQKQCFGNLFFLLQTESKYLAKLTRSVAPTEIDELLQIVMFSLYGNQYEAREEHLLLKMFELALQMEFDETDEFGSLLRANTAISRMMTTYTRRGPGQEYLKETLQELVQTVNENSNLNLEVNPARVYCELYHIDDNEKNGITMETALRDPRVAEIVRFRLKGLEDIAARFFDSIVSSIDYVPYGIRWLCKAIYQLCREKFPNVSVENITGLIGAFFLLRFINPAIVSPHSHMLLSSQPRANMRRNFVLIAKILQAISNKGASQTLKEVYMKPLERFVASRQEMLQQFLHNLCDVDDFHSYLEIEQYLSLPKGIYITITLKEMHRLHELLCKYQDFLITDDNDRLTILLEELGVPTPSDFVEDVSVDVSLLSRWDVTSNLKEDISELDHTTEYGMKAHRKHCRKILIRLLSTAPYLMRELTLQDAIALGQMSPDEEIARLSHIACNHLSVLQKNDTKYKEDLFYGLVKDLVIKQELQQDRMMRELNGLKKVKETLEYHGDFLSQQLDAYKEYLQAVRNKAAIKEGRVSSPGKPNKHQHNGPFKFTYTQLEKDGVILESRSFADKKKGNIYFTVACIEPGIYKITLHYKTPLPGHPAIMELDLHLEDLLELQHFRDPILNLNDVVVLDVRRTLLFLHKHFAPKKL